MISNKINTNNTKNITSNYFLINRNNNKIIITFKTPNEILIKSIINSKILNGACIIKESNEIVGFAFYSETICTLTEFIKNGVPYNTLIRLIWCINKQQTTLKSINYGFYQLNTNDIIVIDDYNFLCINSLLLKPINVNGLICFNHPFNKNKNNFLSPELSRLNEIPSSVSYKTIYYTIGLLAFFSFFGKDYENASKESNDLFNSIINTKLYWFFKHSLTENIENRLLLFI